MFIVNPMPEQIAPDLVAELEKCEVATIGHVLHSGFVDPDIRAVLPGKRVAGTAVTLRIPHADSTLLHYLTAYVRPGDVVVIERCGDARHACWGGVITNAMKMAGVKAGVIDGPATDFSEIVRVDMPMWCRGPSPITTKLLGLEGALNVPVNVGGQTVSPGDAVLCDESGVVVLKPAEAPAVAARAIAMQEAEVVLLSRLAAGEKLPDISGARAMVEAKLLSA
ncbi:MULTISPECIES: RraA family protein [Xanthobacter]|uniref:Putative 4-hydroxy-4-methyl-2-oxoglutarate aldolase n=1 Tax=Xanthobacter flavus TaxID=281 RepID=A0A9W6FJX3_XANFL|nr:MULTISPECIES: RraA family protein [Xanthobacter]MBN8916225.1 RraA family protein [Hyphomicrobiales bacterium]MDR6334819.1 regulator of RNase E activity RraA [Xanthobacter flavus]NMN57159.1 regulator of RNase E activity RraA [Xanthobacter sp. SG618]UDQ87241.1 RraA family protein [Xanthobacter autotrophicus]UJX44725.1 RraA family protein [Xanthobacter sp. YC-JY1]